MRSIQWCSLSDTWILSRASRCLSMKSCVDEAQGGISRSGKSSCIDCKIHYRCSHHDMTIFGLCRHSEIKSIINLKIKQLIVKEKWAILAQWVKEWSVDWMARVQFPAWAMGNGIFLNTTDSSGDISQLAYWHSESEADHYLHLVTRLGCMVLTSMCHVCLHIMD